MNKALLRRSLLSLVGSLSFVGLTAVLVPPQAIHAFWENIALWACAIFILIFTCIALYPYYQKMTAPQALNLSPANNDTADGPQEFLDEREEALALVRAFTHLSEIIETRDRTLVDQVEKAEAANRAKSDFLVSMSHELRTPMHAIMNFAEMGKRKTGSVDNTKLVQYFTRIEESGERLLALINGLLDLTKLEAGKVEFAFSKADIRDCIASVIAELEPLYKKKEITCAIKQNIKTTANMCFDHYRIVQVLINLMSNAIRYSKNNTTITIMIEKAPLHLGYQKHIPGVAVSIIDQGVGIPDGELETIFHKFIQSTNTRPGSGGSGMGLAICREIINAHNGRIWAENMPEGGAKLTFIIPENYERDCGKTREKKRA